MAALESARPTIRIPFSQSISAAAAPTLPKPMMEAVRSFVESPRCFTVSRRTVTSPWDVAVFLPRDPPMHTGLPVTTPGTEYPFMVLYVSIIQAITCSLVYISGAGMSDSGPISIAISYVYLRVMRFISLRLIFVLSQAMPPLAPPNGTSITAHFHVISAASVIISLSETFGWYLIPPFAGPRAVL